MIKMDPFDCYKEYVSIKTHFHKVDYNYFKHKKKKISYNTFSKRNDHYFFVKLSKNYKDDEIVKFFVANFIDDEFLWIGDALDSQSEIKYKEWQKRIQSLSYMFSNDIDRLLSEHEFDEVFKVNQGQHPVLLKLTLAKYIMIETFIILDALLNFVPEWNKQISEKIIWPGFCKKAQKYAPFLEVDKTKFRKILRKKLDIL